MPLREEIAVHSVDYQEHVNPQWVRLLDALQMNVRYRRCTGVELLAEDGRRFLDFLSAYCVHNTGHNHPAIIEALQWELNRPGAQRPFVRATDFCHATCDAYGYGDQG